MKSYENKTRKRRSEENEEMAKRKTRTQRKYIFEETRTATIAKPRRCEDRDKNSNDEYDHDCDETDGNDANDGNVQ